MNSWLARRAALAIGLMVCFYLLALGVSGGLLWVAYADVVHAQRTSWRLVLFCVAGGGSVLWAIIPRADAFESPGPRITEHDQPELFALIRDVAARTKQTMPEEVYLLNDVNAFVSQRGGIMGFGSRRVMGLGLPLMQTLTVDEFTGVVAHEFGHYHSGDVALGPWIHKTRVAIGRTLEHLEENILRFIFQWYGMLFLRLTQAVSRRQEFVADEVAAAVVGRDAMSSGLRKVSAAAFAYQSYWYSELTPVLRAGYRPPVASGFGRYMDRPHMVSLFEALVKKEETEGQTDPYDSHPSLRDRLEALAGQGVQPHRDRRPASSLLRDIPTCERDLFGTLNLDLAQLKPLEWARVSEMVYAPIWRDRVARHGTLLQDYTVSAPPTDRAQLLQIGRRVVPSAEATEDACIEAAWQLLVAAFCLSLEPLGWIAATLPGDEVVLQRHADEFRPWTELSAVVEGQRSLDEWRSRCLALGIDGVALAPVTLTPEGAGG